MCGPGKPKEERKKGRKGRKNKECQQCLDLMLILLYEWSRAGGVRQKWNRARGPNPLSFAHLICRPDNSCILFTCTKPALRALLQELSSGGGGLSKGLKMSSLRAGLHHLCGTPSSHYIFPATTVLRFDPKHTYFWFFPQGGWPRPWW